MERPAEARGVSERPSAILLLGERGRATDEAEACASELFELRAVARYPRHATRLGAEVEQALASRMVDFILSVLSPVILPPEALRRARIGAVNFHPAPPEWPGVGAASYALYAGDRTYGVTAHIMEERVDAGQILRVDRFPIDATDTCDSLMDRAIAQSLAQFRSLAADLARARLPDPSGDRWAHRATSRRDFERWMTIRPDDPADEIERKIRALRSARFPGPFVELAGERFELPPQPKSRAPAPTDAASSRLPWWEPRMTGGELGRLRTVIERNFLNDGPETADLERRIARLLGVRHAVCVTSGTAALFLALAAAGVGSGDEVLVPDLTFIASANAVALTGAKPVLVDIDPRTLNIDVAAASTAITDRTRAIMPVHVSGRGADMTAIRELARTRELAIVEDAAEAFRSFAHGAYLGTHGIAGCFSFSPNKTVTSGQGGAIVTNDDALHTRLRELKDQGRPVRGTGGDDPHPSVGYNFKFTDLQAAVLSAQLEALEERLDRQRDIQRAYRRGLADVAGIELLPFDLDGGEIPQWTDALADRRDELVDHLERNGAGCRRFWHPIHVQPPYRASDSRFPGTSAVAGRAVWLPSAFSLGDADIERVCGLIRTFYRA